MDWPKFEHKNIHRLTGEARWKAQVALRQQALPWFKNYIIGQTLTPELTTRLKQVYSGALMFITDENNRREGNLSLICVLYDPQSLKIVDIS